MIYKKYISIIIIIIILGHTDRVISIAVSNPFYTFQENESDNCNDQNISTPKVKVLRTLVVSGSRDEMLRIW